VPSITLTTAVRANLLALQSTTDLQGTTQQRLATGKKVNSALDNPTNYFTAAALSARASELTNLLDSMTNGINTLKAADNGLASITTTLQSMQATVTQARQDASWQSASYTLDSTAIGTTTAKSISFSGGAVGTTPVQVALNSTGGAGTAASSVAGEAFSSLEAALAPGTSGSITAPNAYDLSFSFETGRGFVLGNANIQFDGTTDGSTPIAAASSGDPYYTEAEAISFINYKLVNAHSTIRASDSSGHLTFANSATGTASNFKVTSFLFSDGGFYTGGPLLQSFSTNTGTDGGAGVGFTIAVNGGGPHNISVSSAEVVAGADSSNGGVNSVNLVAAINAKLVAAGIATVQAVKSGTAGVSAGSDTITLQATTNGPGTTFTLSNIYNSVVGGTSTAASGSAGATFASGPGIPLGANTYVGFTITINGNPYAISVDMVEVQSYFDLTHAGINSVNLREAINAKLVAAGITTVKAVKSGATNVSATTDTISLQATETGSANTFAVSNIDWDVIGSSVTPGTDSSTTVTAGTNGGGGTGSVYTVDQLVSSINGNTSLIGKVKASNNAGQLQITDLSTSALTLTGVTSGGTIDGGSGTGTVAANTTRHNLVVQFNQLKDQLDKTAQDASFNGINLLAGDQLKLYFNETSTSSVTIQSTNTSGISSSTLGVTSGTDAEFQRNTMLDTRLQGLQTAVTTAASQASAFGNNLSIVQNRQTFTNAMVNTLQTGADGLTLADGNLEGANMLALQTRQQLSIQALSLASQANQAVLRLFG
jgi:flagellin